MVTENALDIDRIMKTLISEPRFVMEYMPLGLSRGWWWTRKHWMGRDAVIAFYKGFFRNFGSLHITPLRYTLSATWSSTRTDLRVEYWPAFCD